VTIAVTNVASAIEFFGLLGFREERSATIDDGPPAQYMGMPDMKAKHITLALEGCEPRFEVQLLEFDPRPPDDPGEHPTNLRRRGYNHLAFRVDDIKDVTARLVANGVNMLSDEMDYNSRRLRLFEGPEGITLELVQWVDSGNKKRQ
jgi:catechol 2,3-dioxygenase-like lactoylglutathione lyase family enzyme